MNAFIEFFKYPSLTRRLMFRAAGIGVIAVVLFSSAQIAFLQRNGRMIEHERLESYLSLFSSYTEHFIRHDEKPEERNAHLRELASALNVNRVVLSNENGETLWNYSGSGSGGRASGEVSDSTVFSVDGIEYQVSVSTPAAGVLDQSHLDLLIEFSFPSLLVVFLLSVMLYQVRSLILQHLKTVARYARNLSAENLNETLKLENYNPKTSRDELSTLVEALEQMRQQFVEDLDQRRAIELALIAEKEEKIETRRLIEETRASDRAKSQFIATMSHEIRTPMNGVIGMVEMLRDTKLNEAQTHYVEVISRSSDSLMRIINDILDYSKIEAGKMSLERTEFNLEQLLADCLQLFGGTAVKKNIELISNIAPDTPLNFIGDPTRLKQILVNLVGNAFKFTSSGHIYIEVYSVNGIGDAIPTLFFSVADSGIGIAEQSLESIFEAFKQADNTTTRKYGGTGLGLAICKQLVELMGGKIGVRSQRDRGSLFWFTCPLSLPQSEISEALSCSLALSGKRLLYVHHESFLDDALSAHCRSYGMSLDACRNSSSALEQLAGADLQYHFIVLNDDLGGDLRGWQLAIRIREHQRYAAVPIILLSSKASSTYTLDQLAAVSNIMTCPFGLENILKSLMTQNFGISLGELMPTKIELPEKTAQLNVLVAEDNVVNRMVIEGLLEKLNVKPDFSENGSDAVQQYSSLEKKYDLIFMDCEMPEMDGFEATLMIRRWERDRGQEKVPIIALTAHVEAEHRQRVFEVGMNYYLSKPVTLEKISDALNSLGLL